MPNPTPDPDVDAVLRLLLSRVRAVLGDRFVALYLYGSLAAGGFDPETSDVDFVVVTAHDLPADVLAALEAMHVALAARGGWAAKLEGAYLPRPALRRHRPDDPPRPYWNEGRWHLARLGADWIIQRHVLREHGVVVAGPSPRPLIDPVGPDHLRRAVRAELRDWWAPMLTTPDPRLAGREYQAYAVLSLCRALVTLRHGTIVSKPAAARWAHASLGERWAPVVARALTWRDDPQTDRLDETLAFVRFAVAASTADESGG